MTPHHRAWMAQARLDYYSAQPIAVRTRHTSSSGHSSTQLPFDRSRSKPSTESDSARQNDWHARVELAHAHWVFRTSYGRRRFDESKHPRVPKGRRKGGQFTNVGKRRTPGAFFVPKSLQPFEKLHRERYEQADQLTTAELQTELHARTAELLRARTAEDKAYARLWTDRLRQVLKKRGYSDQNAPLAVKQRIWQAQQKYSQLFDQHQKLETWIAQSKRTIWKSSASVGDAHEKLAAVKRAMEDLAAVTGAKLPQHDPIRTWSFEQKLAAAADLALKSDKLAPEVAQQLRLAMEPANLARMGAMMAALAIAHSYPVVGLAADGALLAAAGTEGLLAGHRIYLEVNSIQSEADVHAAAKVLEQELASQASGQLMKLLTLGAAKTGAKFHKNYKVTIDHERMRRLSNGSMPLTPGPRDLVPLKIQKRTDTTSKSKKKGPVSGPSVPKKTKVILPTQKPALHEPGAAEWRYRRYRRQKRGKGEKALQFDLWKKRHFDTAASGGRPGRPGGPAQVRARKLLQKEGYTNVENVRLGSHYPDMVRSNSRGGKDYIEVGKMLQSQKPVSRERKKLARETEALEPNDTITFVDQHDLTNRITYHPRTSIEKEKRKGRLK